MTSLRLGWKPPHLTVILVPGSTYALVLESELGWPVDVVDLHFSGARPPAGPVVWPATITGTRASWNKTIAQVGEVINSGSRFVDLRYTKAGSDPTIWYWGAVEVATR